MAIKYLMCMAGGVLVGYFYAHARLEEDFNRRLERETDEARDYYRRKYAKKARAESEEKGPDKVAAEMAEDVRKVYGGESVVSTLVANELSKVAQKGVVTGDLGVSAHPQEDRVAEAVRKKGVESNAQVDAVISQNGLVEKAAKAPAINYNRISTPAKVEEPKAEKPVETEDEMDIQVEEIDRKSFVDKQFGYTQFSFTYFAGDDILANEDDEPVTGAAREASIGPEALRKLKLGREAMGGNSEIFLRNHTGKWEFEVTRSEGKFSVEVGAGTE